MKAIIPLLIKANLLLHGLFFFISGLLGSIDTKSKLVSVGLAANGDEGVAVFKVIYGGLMMAIGAIFLAGFVRKSMERFSLLAIAIVMTALILSRMAALLSSGTISTNHLTYMAIEIVELTLTCVLLHASVKTWTTR